MSESRPLSGLQVLEFSHTIMGPCAGLLLADLGADVIKIEPAPDGDKTRFLHGFAAGFFATFNRNKRSVSIDLKQQSGQQLVHRLVAETDIVLDNYGPGTMEKLGCGWEQLSAINSRLLYLSLKGYLAGPWQDRPALDEVVQFQSGLAYMTGPPGQPLRAGASVIDILGAVFGVSATLAALRERDISGKGQRVGSALFESAAFLMASHMVGGAVTGQQVPPMTARKGAWGIYDVFSTACNTARKTSQNSTGSTAQNIDGKSNESTADERQQSTQLFIGVTSDAQWQRFCLEFSLDHLYRDARLATNPQRTLQRDWLLPELREVIAALPFETVIDKCQRADVSWSPVGQPEDLLQNEQLLANGGLLATSLSTAVYASDPALQQGDTLIPGLPLEFGEARERPTIKRQPPELGEHTTEVLSACGITDAEISRLQHQNVIVGPK